MNKLIFLTILCLGALTSLHGQDFYLPVSTTSETAKKAYYKANELASNIKFEEANIQLDKALEEDPNFFMAYVVKIYYAPSEKRAPLIDKALAIDVSSLNNAESIIRQQLPIWKKDPKAGIADNMKALVAAFPKTPQAYHWASLHSAYTDKDKDAALDYALKLKKLSPDFSPNYNTLGYMYMEKGNMKKARQAFDNYIRYAPEEANAYDSMGEYFMNVKDYAKSAEYYDQAVKRGMATAQERAEKAREMMASQ